MDANEVNKLLNQRAEEVCAYLLPNGCRKGHQWTVGDIRNTPPKNKKNGGSLNIELEGGKCGVWADFDPTEELSGPTLLHLWMEVRHPGDFFAAKKEAMEWLGVKPKWERTTFIKPTGVIVSKTLEQRLMPVKEGSTVWKYLREERGHSEKAIRKFEIGESYWEEKKAWYVMFPFRYPDRKLAFIKYRNVKDKGDTYIQPTKKAGARMILFGMDKVDPKASDVVITEGEHDAIAMYDLGYDAVSVPMGAKSTQDPDKPNPNDEWLTNCHDWLERFDKIYMGLDNDEPGKLATASILPRLRRERCYVIAYPSGTKDANDCWRKEELHEGLVDSVNEAKSFDPIELKRPRDFIDEIWHEFYPYLKEDSDLGDELPWDIPFRFRRGELTIWHGYNASGKTVQINHALIHLAATKKRKSCIASFEVHPRKTLRNMLRVAMGKDKPGRIPNKAVPLFRRTMTWIDQYIFVYDWLGIANPESVLDVFAYCIRKYGVDYLYLDSLMCLDVGEDDWVAQSRFMSKLVAITHEYGVHTILVCHSKKPDARRPEDKTWPDKYSISGSGNLSNKADNVICSWRNRSKESELIKLKTALLEAKKEEEKNKIYSSINKYEGHGDAMIIVQKQRETGEEPLRNLWFDKRIESTNGEVSGSWQFCIKPEIERVVYVE